ncbi:MAG: anhydro-N-acetylmuramic acid kinase [Phycisphaeraceae bacterium]
MAHGRTRIVAGCMTGTSLDGLDVALVKIVGTGPEMRAELLGHRAVSFADGLRGTLRSIASGEANEPLVFMRAARALGEMHADALRDLFADGLIPTSTTVDFVAAHGQTIWHAPGSKDNNGAGMSWQLFDPWPIVRRLDVPVCYDLRQTDLIAGGEGAPLTPIADWVMYRKDADWVVNLGGVMNLTELSDELALIRGGDHGVCNLLLDGLCRGLTGQRYDEDGRLADGGRVLPEVLADLHASAESVSRQGSLGREQYSDDWLKALVSRLQPLGQPADVLRSACHWVACSLQEAIGPPRGDWPCAVLAGGGARNLTLMREIEEVCFLKAVRCDDLGIPCEAREAMAWAVLGALSHDGVPISLPRVTGATDPGVAGVWAGI